MLNTAASALRTRRGAAGNAVLAVGSGLGVVRRPGGGSEQKVATGPGPRYQPPSYSETFARELP